MRLLLCLLVVFSPCSQAAFQWDDVGRIVVVGDVHGAYPRLVGLLQGIGVIDEALAWAGGDTHLVSLGDLLDRGPQSRKAMDLLMRLQPEAEAGGGRVHVLLGNHEVMNLTGDVRDVSAAELAALTDLGGHQAAFAADGYYGRWLLGLPFVIRINDTVFAHGGFPRSTAAWGVDRLNQQARNDLRTVLGEGRRLRQLGVIDTNTDLMIAPLSLAEEALDALGAEFVQATNSPLLGGAGPLWYRGTAACHPLIETDPLRDTLAALGAVRAVVGHTPTPDRQVNMRMDGSAFIVDTGMLASHYSGRALALEIRGDLIRAFGARGEAPITAQPVSDPLTILGESAYVTHTAADDSTLVEFSGTATVGRFVKLSKRDARRALAAFRLDRLLGLNMVPATVRRDISGSSGIVMAWPHNAFTEQVRQERQLARPNYCEQGSDFALLAAFDALQGKRDRGPGNLLYDPGTWHVLITENHRAFGTNARLPEYSRTPTLPATMARALARLDAATLTPLLGDLLKAREIAALLKRRDAILAWGET